VHDGVDLKRLQIRNYKAWIIASDEPDSSCWVEERWFKSED